jgi:hypothetical protein
MWSSPHMLSTLRKLCTRGTSGCPTKVQKIHPPRGSSQESMLPHQPTQIQGGPSGHNDKSENQPGVSGQGQLDPR